jgi:hypothetical protein
MIVLDEQLLGRRIDREIAKWYRGRVVFITDLRPDTVIKDEAIPGLLCRQKQATFITINEKDFWLKVPADSRYCIICFTLSDVQATEIPQILQALFGQPEFKTKAARMGKVIRRAGNRISYYMSADRQLIEIDLPVR